MKKIKQLAILTLIFTALLSINLIELPYYITKPGITKELDRIVEVEERFEGEGSFSLTTVSIGRANPYTYVWANLQSFYEIYPVNDVKYENESDEDYLDRQLYMMESSQDAAISLAYEEANREVDLDFNGIIVGQVFEGMPAEGKLKVGDRIFKVDGQRLQSSEQMISYVNELNSGDSILLTLERDDKEMEVEVNLSTFSEDSSRIGVGISLINDYEVHVSPDVEINTSTIGGPSAGLMISLEIFNQLTETDYSKGYTIAGTGTIDQDGTVGPIGGIHQKVVAADEAGVDIFFAPNEMGVEDSNYQIALQTAKDINSNMNIVPVDTFEEAVNYLKEMN
ncbi:SepM family pheromone-processing serine protease [Bacillus carboniphilus]|uniref:SepM family pheromone-processing serine protease n=1 Tax=Bacillus carboniphilus TaxID=86663 RepID=UPI0021F5A247